MNPQLLNGEVVEIQIKPHSRFSWYWAVSRSWKSIIILIIIAIIFVFQGPNHNKLEHTKTASMHFFSHYGSGVFVGLLALCVVLFLLTYIWAKLAIKYYDYYITNKRCILSSGFLSINRRTLPYSSINDVNIRASLIERLFGLTSIYLDSVGTIMSGNSFRTNNNSNNTTRLEGIPIEDSENIMNIISKYTTGSDPG